MQAGGKEIKASEIILYFLIQRTIKIAALISGLLF